MPPNNLKITQGNTEFELIEFNPECVPSIDPITDILNFKGIFYFLKAIPNKPKQVMGYEILSFIDINHTVYKLDGGLYKNGNDGDDFSLTQMLKGTYSVADGCLQINSVQRISDSEIFTLGDVIELFGEYPTGEIHKFVIDTFDNTRIAAYNKSGYGKGLEACKKVKPLILTTEEGIAVYEPSQKIYIAQEGHVKNSFIVFSTNAASCQMNFDCKYFHSKVNRDQFVKDNSPKQKLFTTHNGVDIFKEDKWFVLWDYDKTWSISESTINNYDQYFKGKRFSTIESAQQYRLENKPIEVSLKELNDYMSQTKEAESRFISAREWISDFFKSKINP